MLKAEIFPWALLYVIIHNIKVVKYAISVLVVLVFSSAYTVYLNYHNQEFSIIEIIRSDVAYLNSVLIFIFIIKLNYYGISRFNRIIVATFIFLTVLGLMQYSGYFNFLQPIFSFLVPRAQSGDGGFRGITLLSSEPSRAGIEYLFLGAYIYTLQKEKFLKNLIIALLSIYIIFFIKSLDGLVLLIVFFTLYFRSKFLLIIAPFSLILYLVSQTDLAASNRALAFINDIFSLKFWEVFDFITNISGFRISSIFSAFYYGINNLFGAGVGNWQNSSIEAHNLFGYDPTKLFYFIENGGVFISLRPSSFLANSMLDFGLIGTVFFLFKLLQVSSPFLKRGNFNFFSLFLFSLFFVSSVGNPVPWICCALSLRNGEH